MSEKKKYRASKSRGTTLDSLTYTQLESQKEKRKRMGQEKYLKN